MISADVLTDYMLGRVSERQRARIRSALSADPAARGALRRMRRTSKLLEARAGAVGAVPREWIDLLDQGGSLKPMTAEELARERTKTWL